jgi:hypothetical protein
MNIKLTQTLVAALLGSIALTAHAVPITGQINIAGTVLLNPMGTTLASATSANATTGTVNIVEGTYPVTLLGDTAIYKAFNFAIGAQPIPALWTVTDVAPTGFTYSFDLATISTFTTSGGAGLPSNLFLAGSGLLSSSDPNLTPTSGMWTYNINSADGSPTGAGTFSFQSNNVGVGTPVPDGGSTVVLLGTSLFALGLLASRRKLTR